MRSCMYTPTQTHMYLKILCVLVMCTHSWLLLCVRAKVLSACICGLVFELMRASAESLVGVRTCMHVVCLKTI